MSERIPTRGDLPFYDQQVVLEGVTYTLQFRWNVRLGAWFLTVLNSEGATVIHGDAKLVVNWPINAYVVNRQPPGALVAVDTSSEGREIEAMEDLGSRVQLVYFTTEELGLE